MCSSTTWHNPLHCVVPPHMLEQLARRGRTSRLRQIAENTLGFDNKFRGTRLEITGRRFHERAFQREQELLTEPILAELAAGFNRQRTIYDVENRNRLPGRRVRTEGAPPTNDAAVDEAYDGLGDTFDLFADIYGRNSIDNHGMPLDGHVHFGLNYDNAFWDGKRMVFGDGDNDLFNRFTIAVDIMGHELTHGVTEHEARLLYLGQSGALNESISDVFGSLVKQRRLNQSATAADWLIGEGLFTARVNGVALRSMKAPGTAYDDAELGKDPQPAHMDDYVRTYEDNGGVHINSGICNRAFYLAATNIGGYAWEEAGLVWYETLLSPFMRAFMRFDRFALLTVITAAQLFGVGAAAPAAIFEAWREVGVLS